MLRDFVLVCMTIFLLSCESNRSTVIELSNPPAEGFNLVDSDKKAIALADSVMLALGGRKAWDATEYLKWNFFGSRRHYWNKHTGDIVIEGLKDSFLIDMNLEDMTGSVVLKDIELTKQDSLDKYLQKGREMWINDAYWIYMPFKLKDSGVTLKHLGQDTTQAGADAELLSLTFERVGVTPNNKYVIYVDSHSHMITQWDFYTNSDDSEPRFSTPWLDYKNYDGIQLSSSRGPNYTISDIAVGSEAMYQADK